MISAAIRASFRHGFGCPSDIAQFSDRQPAESAIRNRRLKDAAVTADGEWVSTTERSLFRNNGLMFIGFNFVVYCEPGV